MEDRVKNRLGGDTSDSQGNANRRIVLLTGVSLAIAFLFASLYPSPLILTVLSGTLFFVAAAAALMALVTRQRLTSRSLTLWDKAAFLSLASVGAGMFVDPHAVSAFIEAQMTSLGGAPDGAP